MVASNVRQSLLDDVKPPESARPEALVDPLLGIRLGNYEINFVLGKGAYGAVYKARDVTLGRYVAIKFLHEFLDTSHEAMFLQEAKAVAALGKHHSIVTIFEFSEYQGRKYFVLEYVGSHAGMLLRVHPKGLPVEMALRIGKESSEGLAYAHKHNIIHRDIKPANILLEIEGGSAKLADFGVARLFDPANSNTTDTPGGTPAYMAPEIIAGSAGDVRSDVFSLGVTLYELLTGTLPFAGHDAASVMKAIRERAYTPISKRRDLPGSIAAIVEKALADAPDDRFQSAREVIEAIDTGMAAQGATSVHLATAQDNVTRDETRLVKLKAYQLAEDAKHNGCDKLANQPLKEGVELFRDGEAYEQLKQYGPAKKSYEDAIVKFTQAIDRAKVILAKLMALKSARAKMEEIRKKAETARAAELAAEIFSRATEQEKLARATSGVIKATEYYQRAAGLYVEALKLSMSHGETVLVAIRNQLEQIETLLKEEGLLPYLEMEVRHVAALTKQARGKIPDYDAARQLYQAAVAHYREAVPKGRERKQYAMERESRDPITVAGIELVWVPPGHFYMGSDDGSVEEEPRHEVTIAHGFWMGKYPVTQGQWESIMGANPASFKESPELPVENVSWDDCKVFIRKINALGEGMFRLPSEAEWEYACRADSTGDWCFGNDEDRLPEYAWGHENAEGRTHPVGQKKPNDWGLYDMHGNVCEWCEDHRHQDYTGAPAQGQAWLDDDIEERMTRGGSWCIITPECRSAYRGWFASPATKADFMGFRVCRSK